MLVRRGGGRDLVLGIVLADEILDDGARFPEGDARVRVLEGGEPPVGVDRDEGLVLDLGDVRFDLRYPEHTLSLRRRAKEAAWENVHERRPLTISQGTSSSSRIMTTLAGLGA